MNEHLELGWERRQGMRAPGGWRWYSWQPCTEAEARRVTGLQSWQVRQTWQCAACGGTGRVSQEPRPPAVLTTGIDGLQRQIIDGAPPATPAGSAKADALRGLRNLKVLLGTDAPEVRGWAPAVQLAAQRVLNAAIRVLNDTDGEQEAPRG